MTHRRTTTTRFPSIHSHLAPICRALLVASLASAAVPPAAISAQTLTITEAVTWTSLVNVTVTGTTIQKTSGVDGTDDAGAISSQALPSGDGYVEFTAPDNTTSKAVGLSNGNLGTSRDEIDFSWRVRGLASLEVRENGVLRWSSTYAGGDVFRVAIEGGIVRYYQNGVLRYTSTIAPTYPLLVDSSFLSLNASITNAMISYNAPAVDTAPPVRSNGLPSGTLAADTTSAALSLTTNESATCKYATTAGLAYASMPSAFVTTGGTSHAAPVTGLTNGTAYTYYVRCQDSAGNANSDDFVISFSVASPGSADPNALKITSISLDPPTLHVLGVQVLIGDDNNRNAQVAVRYREVGSSTWRDGPPLFRVFPETVPVPVPEQFAGSIFDLRPDTAYEIELHATDVDGPVDEMRLLTARTRAIPRTNPLLPNSVNVTTVSALQTALASAVPGTLIILADGIYSGTFRLSASGTADNPIIIRGESDTGVILDGQGCDPCNVLEVYGSYVHVENLTIQNARRGIRFFNTATRNNVVRRVQIKNVIHGIDVDTEHRDFYICDNIIEGRLAWPWVFNADASTHWDDRGVAVHGDGHVVCHNRISGFGDPMITKKTLARAIDFYGNDLFDNYDGMEVDHGGGNLRVFHNRWTNTSTALSFQPVYGGPAYAVRNVILNTVRTQLKFQPDGTQEPSGMLVYHNTFVSPQIALNLQTPVTAHNFLIMNNLLVGPRTLPGRAVEWTGGIDRGNFDFNAYFPDGGFWMGKINGINQIFGNFAELRASGIFEGSGTLLTEPIFAAGFVGPLDGTVRQDPADFTLASTSNGKDRGTVLTGINQSFTGAAPDLGAYELGCPTPTYGPRPVGSESTVSQIDCNTTPTPDSTPPVLSAITASAITSSGAVVDWTTDEASDSQVEYGPTTAYGSATTLDPTLVTTHSQALSGLTPSTLYHYRVKSKDAAGNPATSGDATFTTLPLPDTTPPSISAVSASGITASAATITWTTDEAADSQVEYGPTTAYGSATTLDPTLVTTHSQALSGLTPSTLYHYRVKSKDAAGNPATSADVSFTTAPAPRVTVEIRVAANRDDAEEKSSGSMYLTSSDLELVYDGSNQKVGLRFNGVSIPPAAAIARAYVQFKTDESHSAATSLTIQGQAVDNAPPFATTKGNISSRAKTTAAVPWSPAPWTIVGAAGPDQRTPDLSAVIQEIIGRPGWASGNSLVLIITGAGRRTAEAYDGDKSGAPLLHVEFY